MIENTVTAYEIQRIHDERTGETEYRITHVHSDSRVATCFEWVNAMIVCNALNQSDPKGTKYSAVMRASLRIVKEYNEEPEDGG